MIETLLPSNVVTGPGCELRGRVEDGIVAAAVIARQDAVEAGAV